MPGGGFDIRVKYVANEEMYNSRAGIKWINRNIYNNGVITYWDAEAGRMVTQKITEYTGKVPIPFTKPGPIANDELFGFLADNWNQLRHHLRNSKSDAQRLQWIEKYLVAKPGRIPREHSQYGRPERQRAPAPRNGQGRPRERRRGRHPKHMRGDVRALPERHEPQPRDPDGPHRRPDREERQAGPDPYRWTRGSACLFPSWPGPIRTSASTGPGRFSSRPPARLGKDSAIYKALFTALEQAKDLKDEAAILAELEKLLKVGVKPVRITRPSEPGKPSEVKIEEPYQKRAFEQAVRENPGDVGFQPTPPNSPRNTPIRDRS